MPYAGVNGRRLYYEVGGEGETVVLLHGSFANADILEAPATAISSGFRAIRYDRRGHGRSGDAPDPLPLAEEAAELAAFLDWFSTEKTHVLAHDDGAEIALQFALDFPERTLSLALLAPTLEGFAWRDGDARGAARPPRGVRAEPAAGDRGEVAAVAHLRRRARARDPVRAPRGDLRERPRVAGGSLERPPHAGPVQAQRLGEIHARTAVLVGDREDAERLRCAVRDRARASPAPRG